MAYLLRTRFSKDIVAEFLPPSSGRSHREKRQRVIILLDGMPSIPKKQPLIEWLSKKGFWVFYPRYRGAWESGGVFLRQSPEKDVIDVIDGLSKGFTDIFNGKKYRLQPDEIFLIGVSFGGAGAILASRDPRVKKAVGISPVVDFRAPNKTERWGWMERFTREAFGNGYRIDKNGWKKLRSGKFYNPVYDKDKIDGSKLFIIHAMDDESVRYHEVVKFARERRAKFVLLKRGGHLSAQPTLLKYWKPIAKFFRSG